MAYRSGSQKRTHKADLEKRSQNFMAKVPKLGTWFKPKNPKIQKSKIKPKNQKKKEESPMANTGEWSLHN